MTVILVTGAGALLGQGIIRAIQGSNLQARIVAVDPSSLSAGLYWTECSYIIERADSPGYIGRLEEVLLAEHPDVVLVGTDVELMILSEHRLRLEDQYKTKILVSDPRVVRIADDKYRTYEFFKSIGEEPPASALPEDEKSLERMIDTVGFPLIVKPRIGARSIGVLKVENLAELNSATAGRHDIVVQECVGTDADEYTAGVIVFDGKAHAAIVMRRDLRDGNTYRAYVDQTPALHQAVLNWGRALAPLGPANFQFRMDRQGRPRVFEINGRFSGTTPLRALAGFNEVELCVRHLLDGSPIVQPRLKDVTILRHWSETVVVSSQILAH